MPEKEAPAVERKFEAEGTDCVLRVWPEPGYRGGDEPLWCRFEIECGLDTPCPQVALVGRWKWDGCVDFGMPLYQHVCHPSWRGEGGVAEWLQTMWDELHQEMTKLMSHNADWQEWAFEEEA